MADRIAIDDVTPVVSCGRYPAKAVRGEHVPVTATVWREGHDAVSATLVWRGPDDRLGRQTRMAELGPEEPDRFGGVMVPDGEGVWTFRVDAWSDPWRTWLHAVDAKVAAGQDAIELANDLELGAQLLERVSRRPERRGEKAVLAVAAAALREVEWPLDERLAPALGDEVRRIMHEHPVRDLLTKGPTRKLRVDRERAAFGSWYEFFPRSTGNAGEHGTFATATLELDRVAAMGFDVVYLPPIHPIGHENRKGPNNTLVAGPDDVGSPWAIGSSEGGHDAIHPALGTIEDFDRFVARAGELGMEVALDLALQCAPDHPWVLKHPEWFTTRPDGTIAYAENPPKRYQDIFPLNFDNDPEGLYEEVLRVVTHWIDHGVKIFRVDNPHTKPPNFWAWLIEKVRSVHPDVLFLAEAFTKPARLWGLAKLGFSQSYTYFTWRTGKQELVEFAEDLVEHWHLGRPNLFVNTPDILHESLQHGGPAMFASRAALAATLAPTWGVYSGYELFEHQAVRAGSEEYLDSEKYQLRHRDYAGELAAGRSLQPWIARLNEIRRAHPALHQLRTLRFHHIGNDNLLAFSKQDPATGDTMVMVITLDPHHAQEGTLCLDLPSLGMQWHDRLIAEDEVSGQTWDWGATNFVRLEPWRAVAHIVAVHR